jgi:hypothetical protein
MDHMCTAVVGSECPTCEQRKLSQETFNELAAAKARAMQLSGSNDKLIMNLVQIAATLGVPPDQVGYDNTILRVEAFKALLKACRIYVSTGDHDFILLALFQFANDPA